MRIDDGQLPYGSVAGPSARGSGPTSSVPTSSSIVGTLARPVPTRANVHVPCCQDET